MSKPLPNLDFKSKEEFFEICQYLSARLHYLNRVAMGESHFAWSVADVIHRAGKTFDDHLKDSDTKAAFGDGYTAGTIARDARAQAVFDLMYPADKDGKAN